MHVDEEPETTSNDAHSNLISTHLPIQAVVRQDVPEEESSDDEPLITLAKQKNLCGNGENILLRHHCKHVLLKKKV